MDINNQNLAGQNDTYMEDLKGIKVDLNSEYILNKDESDLISKASRMDSNELKASLEAIRSNSPASQRKKAMYNEALATNKELEAMDFNGLRKFADQQHYMLRKPFYWTTALHNDIAVNHINNRRNERTK